jgi:acetyl esterase/lipase
LDCDEHEDVEAEMNCKRMRMWKGIAAAMLLAAPMWSAAQTGNPDDAATAQSVVAQPEVPKPQAFQNIVYGHESGVDQVLDVYENAAATAEHPAPVLINVHGGAWVRGQRPKSYGGFRSFLAMGFSVVTVDYRMSLVAPAPAALQDVRCVMAWVKANAAKYNFDASRIVPMGTSAGGHLVLMAAMLPANNDVDLPQCKDVPRAAAVLDFYGPADLRPAMSAAYKSPSVKLWIGDKPDPDAYAAKMSPMTYVRAGLPPVFIAHGDADPVVPHATSELLLAALTKAGVPAELYTVPFGKHGQFPPDQMQIVTGKIQEFLIKNGVLTAAKP